MKDLYSAQGRQSIVVVAMIGLATGGGLYFAASVTTIIASIIFWALKPLEL